MLEELLLQVTAWDIGAKLLTYLVLLSAIPKAADHNIFIEEF
jgi:hypothetical protein